MARNGVVFVEAWNVALYQYSAHGSHVIQFWGLSNVTHPQISFHTRVYYLCLSVRFGGYLLKWSTTTNMESKLPDFGSPSMKSIEISSQTKHRIGKGCRRPTRDRAELLFCWHTGHSSTSFLMSFLIPLQYKSRVRRLYVQRKPKWPPTRLLWYSLSKFGINEEDWGITSRPLYGNLPCSSEKCMWELGSPCNFSLIPESRGSATTCYITLWTSTAVGKVMVESSIRGRLGIASTALFFVLGRYCILNSLSIIILVTQC